MFAVIVDSLVVWSVSYQLEKQRLRFVTVALDLTHSVELDVLLVLQLNKIISIYCTNKNDKTTFNLSPIKNVMPQFTLKFSFLAPNTM